MTSTGIEPAAFGTGIRRATIAPTSLFEKASADTAGGNQAIHRCALVTRHTDAIVILRPEVCDLKLNAAAAGRFSGWWSGRPPF